MFLAFFAFVAHLTQVKFLNVTGAINAAAMTAGLQFIRNLQRWSPVKDSMNFEPLAKLLEEQEAKASEQQQEPGPHKSSETEKAQAEEQNEEETGGEQLTGEQQAQVDTSWPSGGDAKGSSSNGVEVVDPTRVPLPKAPGFKVYCFYGVGSPTERGYHYMKTRQDNKTVWQLNTVAADASSSLVRVGMVVGVIGGGARQVGGIKWQWEEERRRSEYKRGRADGREREGAAFITSVHVFSCYAHSRWHVLCYACNCHLAGKGCLDSMPGDQVLTNTRTHYTALKTRHY